MPLEKIVIWLSLLIFLSGCAVPKAFLDLPAEQRQSVRFNHEIKQSPRVRFASDGARTAREFGGIGLAIAGSIERSTNAYGKASSLVGSFEVGMIHDRFVHKLSAAGQDIENAAAGALRLELRVQAVGLREVERERFVPFADAVGRLFGNDGKELWNAHAQSSGPRPRAIAEFRETPELYRDDFEEVARDLANQLVEGPVRAITF